MEEEKSFATQLQSMLVEKQRWYNNERLGELLEEFRLLHTCVKTVYDFLIKKSLVNEDPYRMDQRISDIEIPATTTFAEGDIHNVLGERFSKYETMLDFVCTYYRFSVESLTLSKIKKLLDLNNSFYWDDVSMNSVKSNTKSLAIVINKAKMNSAGLALSMLTDSVDKCVKASKFISKFLTEFVVFQREFYKGIVRKDVMDFPDFNKAKVNSVETEIAEIKRVFPKVMGKRLYYAELVSEIANEDFGEKKEQLREKVLSKLQIEEKKETVKKEKEVDTKEYLINAVLTMGALAPSLIQLRAKLIDNFDLLFTKKETFFSKLIDLLKNSLGIPPKKQICEINIVNPKTGASREETVVVNDFLAEVEKKIKTYNIIATRNSEYSKIVSSTEDVILTFLNKQISDIQSLFSTLNALDLYFKSSIEGPNKLKIKGMKIDLDALRNTIINVNKKRGEYISTREENEQLKKLGIKDV